MAIVTLAEQKAHLGILDNVDDTLISGKIASAQAWIESFLGYSIEVKYPIAVPADLVEAVKQQAAHFYENREAVTAGVTFALAPNGVAETVDNYRLWWAASDG